MIEKESWAVWDGEHFAKKAARGYAHTVVADVRRATFGPPGQKNTHPFIHGRFIFAHNGSVPNFEQVRLRMLDEINPLHRAEVKGQTDSEHLFRYLLTRWSRGPQTDLRGTAREGLESIVAWCHEVDLASAVGLNIVLTDDELRVGSRLNRTLWLLERNEVIHCEICGRPHVRHGTSSAYRAVEVASGPLTAEDRWTGAPNGTVLAVGPDYLLSFEPWRLPARSVQPTERK